MNELVGELTMELHSQNSVPEDTKVEDQAGESVEVKYEAVEEKGALSARVEHEEEPPMKEEEEFATVVEYWVTRSPTKLLPSKPPNPEATKTITAEVWAKIVAAASTHSSGYVNAARPSPKPPNPEATTTVAVKALAEMVIAKHLPTDSGSRKEKQEPIFGRLTKEEMETGVEVECYKVNPISNMMGQAYIRNEKWAFGKMRKQWEFGEEVYLLELMGQAQTDVWRKIAQQLHQSKSRVGMEITPHSRIRERQF